MIRKSTLDDPSVKRAKKARQKSPKTEKPLKEVKAEFGKWSYVSDPAGKLMSCEGRFPENRLKEAAAAARNLEKEIITCNAKGEPEYRTPVWERHEWVIRLERHNDNMDKFDKWMLKRNLLPGRKEELQDLTRESYWQERVSEARKMLPYPPMPESHAAWLVNKMLVWEAVGKREGRMAHTPYPAVAFQVALYLKKHGYIETEDYERIRRDIKHLPTNCETLPDGREFALTIPAGQVERFVDNFHDAGKMKTNLNIEQELAKLPPRQDDVNSPHL